MNKKQVGALLKIISKDTAREVLTLAHIAEYDGEIVLQGTDGYVLAMIKLDKEDAQEYVGKSIRRASLEKWYKLATGKSRLDTQELINVLNEDYGQYGEFEGSQYPDFKVVLDNAKLKEVDEIVFNADFAKNLQDLNNGNALRYKMHGKLAPLIAKSDLGTFVLMPMK